MDVRIGIKNATREIAFETELTSQEVIAKIEEANKNKERFVSFSDSKNSEWFITTQNINYVEFGSVSGRKVGFVN